MCGRVHENSWRRPCGLVTRSWCMDIKALAKLCSSNVEYLTIRCRPFYLTKGNYSASYWALFTSPPQLAQMKHWENSRACQIYMLMLPSLCLESLTIAIRSLSWQNKTNNFLPEEPTPWINATVIIRLQTSHTKKLKAGPVTVGTGQKRSDNALVELQAVTKTSDIALTDRRLLCLFWQPPSGQ